MKILCNNIVNPSNSILSNTLFTIESGKILIGKDDNHEDNIVVENSIAFPGLINIHDHLKYSWHKRIGKGEKIEENQQKYENVYQWLEDLYKAFDCVFDGTNKGLDIMFQFGLYKQIFSATTTVLNHSRHSNDVLHSENQHINIVENIESELLVQPELISNVTSHSLSFGRGFNKNNQKPFMIHAAEGVDIHTKEEISILNQRGWLTPQTILVHCINTDNKDLELIANNKCSVVWCPYTSDFVIGKIANIQEIIAKGIN
jgi:cytosine/adenosine deaminase-related metal-dependent hydrolase